MSFWWALPAFAVFAAKDMIVSFLQGVYFLEIVIYVIEQGNLESAGCFQNLSGDMVKECLNENGFLYQNYAKNCHISNVGPPSIFIKCFTC